MSCRPPHFIAALSSTPLPAFTMSSFRRARKPYSRPTAPDGQWVHDKAPTGSRGDTGRSRAAAAPAAATSTNAKLLVSNLHYEITPKDLTSIFGQIGTLVRDPLIRYDRSGRSSGTAIISFETATEATRAKKQFDGILAKGQPMSIAFDTLPPRAPRRAASVPTSLINRIQKAPLLDRLSRDDTSVTTKNVKAPSGPRGSVGPIRSKNNRGGGERAPRQPKKAKTAEELDQELDAFMGDSEATAPVGEAQPAVAAEKQAVDAQDVEMA